MSDDGVLPGRRCGSCSLCCEIPDIPPLDKPANQSCVHQKPGGGCLIYDDRPGVCAGYLCGYLVTPSLGREWRPDRAGFFVDARSSFINFFVDPKRPRAWKREPFYSQIKQAATQALKVGKIACAVVSSERTVILPDRDVDIGEIFADDELSVTRGADGRFEVRFVKRNPAHF